MTDGLKSYPKHKDSGVPWLGDVPEHWDVLPNRAIFDEIKERDRPDADMLSVTITKGVIRQQALLEDSSKKDSSKLDRSACKFVRPGDIAYNKMRAWQGAVGVSEYEGIVSPAYVVQRPREGAAPRYVHYLLRTPAFAKEAERWSYGITSDMWSLRPEHFKLIYSCLPPLTEQAAIVRFLDHADRRIRRYIRAKLKLVKLLEEQKQAIIHRAVTGQIDVRTGKPYPAYKPSGVEWLGDVPEHWEVVRLGRLLRERRETNDDGKVTEVLSLLRDRGVIPYDEKGNIGNKKSDDITRYKIVRPDDIVLNCMNVIIGSVGLSVHTGCLSPVYYVLVRRGEDSPRFLNAIFQTPRFHRGLVRIGNGILAHRMRIPMELLKCEFLPRPPVAEQHEIVRFIDETTATLAATLRSATREVELLREFRTRLIADVVTGKRDVRDAAARLPDEAEDPEPLDGEEGSQGEELIEAEGSPLVDVEEVAV